MFGENTLIDLGVSYAVSSTLTLSLKAANALNEEYYPSADDKAVYAPGRSFRISGRMVF